MGFVLSSVQIDLEKVHFDTLRLRGILGNLGNEQKGASITLEKTA